MFEIRDNGIYVTRGDSFSLDMTVYDEGGAEYALDILERLRFSVYDIDTFRTITEVYSAGGSNLMEVSGEETSKWHGRLGFDIRLIYADGSGETLIGPMPTYIPRVYAMEVGK